MNLDSIGKQSGVSRPNKLNLGCGQSHLAGFLNVDMSHLCKPDLVLDLENELWPWANDSINEVVLDHVLEHLGETKAQYFHVIRELYRVCAHGARIHIRVPHYRHSNFYHDPTHVRIVTPRGLQMLSREHCVKLQAALDCETPLALILDVDFRVLDIRYRFEEDIKERMQKGELSWSEVEDLLRRSNDVCIEMAFELEVEKLTQPA